MCGVGGMCVRVCLGHRESKEISSLVCITSSIVHMSRCELTAVIHVTVCAAEMEIL